jgi:hypothetical protein
MPCCFAKTAVFLDIVQSAAALRKKAAFEDYEFRWRKLFMSLQGQVLYGLNFVHSSFLVNLYRVVLKVFGMVSSYKRRFVNLLSDVNWLFHQLSRSGSSTAVVEGVEDNFHTNLSIIS